jgi:hypothetical protein
MVTTIITTCQPSRQNNGTKTEQNKTYSDILQLMQLSPGVDECLLHKLDAEHIDKSTHNHDGDVAHESRSSDHDSKSPCGKHEASKTTVPAAANEE